MRLLESMECSRTSRLIIRHYATKPLILLAGHEHDYAYSQIDSRTLVMDPECYFNVIGVLKFDKTANDVIDVNKQTFLNSSINVRPKNNNNV